MPIIPILQKQRPTTDAAAPVLDRERRPTLDTGEVQAGLRRVNEAGKMPLMDPQAMAAPYDALGSVGRAVQQAGNVLGALAIKRQEATDKRLINTANMAMQEAELRFKAWQEENINRPELWQDMATKMSVDAVKPFMEMKELSGAARSDLELMAQGWAKSFTIGVQAKSTARQFRLTADSYVQLGKKAYHQGDRATGDAALSEAVAGGYLSMPEAEDEQMKGRITATRAIIDGLSAETDRLVAAGDVESARKLWQDAPAPTDESAQEFDNARKRAFVEIDHRHAVNEDKKAVSLLAYTDPTQGIKDLEDPTKFVHLQPHERAEMLSKMRTAQELAAQEEVDMARRSIDLLGADKIAGATVENLGVELKQATPWHRAVIAEALEAKRGKVDYESRFLSLFAAAGQYRPSGDIDQDSISAARIELLADLLPTPYKTKVIDRLKESREGTGTALVTGVAVAEATRWVLQDDAFGVLPEVFREPKEIGKTKETQALFGVDWLWPDSTKVVKENTGLPVRVPAADPLAKAAAEDKLKSATAQLEREAKLPQNKGWTEDQARARMIEILNNMGAKIPTGKPQNAGPNPNLPPANWQHEKNDLNEFIDTYGN
jgi:hypothetical protein